ncbi:hypothetical protein PROFUN_03162 [Planoprotostelium fungivorum]|uniref:Vacuolar protein sorting-associated protein 52 n=1 Tax=Planoprotostelium fungivorum TaxID=1890364 RepID=A0A2P6NWV2_9EUKA|nr:hypothetical protein PROFUN_03162 [Planoprotostelium fungivorum]
MSTTEDATPLVSPIASPSELLGSPHSPLINVLRSQRHAAGLSDQEEEQGVTTELNDRLVDMEGALSQLETPEEMFGTNSDVSEYCERTGAELKTEMDAYIQDFVSEADNMDKLSLQVKTCQQILDTMSNLLDGFRHDLGEVSRDIDVMQKASRSMKTSLKNRKILGDEMTIYIRHIAVDSHFIAQICDGDINESYQEALLTLKKKIQTAAILSTQPNTSKTASLEYMQAVLDKLKIKAIARIREFLLYRVFSLRKPKTNVQIIQQTILIKYKASSLFLIQYGPTFAEEVKAVYIETLSAILGYYIKNYQSSLLKLQYDVATKYDLIGVQENSFTQIRRKTFGVGNSGVFSTNLGDAKDRSSLLKNIANVPAIIPHIAMEGGNKYPYEAVFHSLNQMLTDTVSSEFLFDCEFFAGLDVNAITISIFDKIVANVQTEFETYLTNCYDILGIYIMMSVNHHNRKKMISRRINYLDNYLDKVDTLLANRFKLVFQMNIDSVKKTLATNLSASDNRPHYITRRYAELLSSMSSLVQNHPNPHVDMILSHLVILRNYMEALIAKLGLPLAKKDRTVFLISNYDLILDILQTEGEKEKDLADRDEYKSFKLMHSTEVRSFVEEELNSYYEPFISFVKKNEKEIISPQASAVERLGKDFSSSFRSVIDQISSDVMNYFSNFRTGTEILSQVLTQLALYYSRFEDIMKS